MRIEFDPTNRDEATAVRRILDAMYPQESRIKANGDGSFSVEYRRDPTDGSVMFTSATEGVTALEETAVPTRTDESTTDVPETDANGEPHDPRIHSTPPTLKNDGTWRAKRGVKAEEIAAVRAEREAALAAQDPAQEQSAPPAPSAPAQAPTPPAGAPVPPAITEQVMSEEPTFLNVMKAITSAQKNGKIDTSKVKELCSVIGAGDSTMGLNGADKEEYRVVFLQVLNLEPKERDAIIEAAKGEPGLETVRTLLGGA